MFKSDKISNKLIVYIILFSSLITLLITLVQLYFEYRDDVVILNNNISNIQTGYKHGITNAVWLDDKQQLKAIIKGINALPDIDYIEIRVDSEIYVSSGTKHNEDVVSQSFPLLYEYDNKIVTIGKTTVVGNLSGIYKRLINRAWILLGSNAIKTFLVATFMFYLFNRLVFSRLKIIHHFIQNHDIANLNNIIDTKTLTKNNKLDEISEIAIALNTKHEELKSSLSELLSLKTTLDLSIDSIAMFYPHNYQFFYANTGITKLTGYSLEELLQMTAADICPTFNDKYLKEIAEHTTDERDHKKEIEINFIHKKGYSIPVELILQYLNPENEDARFVFVAHDITKRKEDERVLLESLEHAKSANIAKSNFLMSMSHELRTPLNAVLGFSQLLELESDSLSQSQNNSVQDILKAGRHLFTIIEEILDLTSIESNNMTLSLELIDPIDLLKDCFKIVNPLAEMANIKLENEITLPSLPKINIDATRFKQVIINLLTNAIKYNKQNGTVTLTYDLLDNHIIRFKITDTGCGIKEEEQANVFTPFSRLGHEASNIEGTGVGLNITKKLVALMNGKINFESNVNEGSVFWVDFPYTSDTLNEEEATK